MKKMLAVFVVVLTVCVVTTVAKAETTTKGKSLIPNAIQSDQVNEGLQQQQDVCKAIKRCKLPPAESPFYWAKAEGPIIAEPSVGVISCEDGRGYSSFRFNFVNGQANCLPDEILVSRVWYLKRSGIVYGSFFDFDLLSHGPFSKCQNPTPDQLQAYLRYERGDEAIQGTLCAKVRPDVIAEGVNIANPFPDRR